MMRFLIGVVLIFTSCSSKQKLIINDSLPLKAVLIHKDNFKAGLKNWSIEQEQGNVTIENGKMDISDMSGVTIWYRKKMVAPIMITYDAVVIDEGNPQDRVSDLNCFWLATDPKLGDDFFEKTNLRNGRFATYDDLKLYYVGLGAHNNTKTRFRKYEGNGNKPLLPEHDLISKEYLIMPNALNQIKIIVYKGKVQYYRNNQLIFNFFDDAPYTEGYFAIRTVNNHMTIDNFKVYSLK